jgi:hypothetical protein
MSEETVEKKGISPDEFMKTDEYQRRAYSYQYKRSVDDIKHKPVTYNGKIYCSTTKLAKKLEVDFKHIKGFLAKNIWRFEGAPTKLELGYSAEEREVTSVWLKLNDNVGIAIWVKDKVDLRDEEDIMIARAFTSLWKQSYAKG